MRAIDLAIKDLLQIMRDWKAAFFLIIMPVAFTLMFGFAFGGFGSGEPADPRLPVALLDQDPDGTLTLSIMTLLLNSEVIRVEEVTGDPDDLAKQVSDEDYAAAIIVPDGYTQQMLASRDASLRLVTDTNTNAGITVQGEIQAATTRLAGAVQAAQVSSQQVDQSTGFENVAAREAFFESALNDAIAAWENPPIAIAASHIGRPLDESAPEEENAFAQSSPGMMGQFAIAGLMGASAVLVLERKNRSLQRLLTTNISRVEILLGHYLAMFVMIFGQLVILILFAQLFLRLDYMREPLATVLLVTATALFGASLGLLIGTLAKSEEQVIIFALIPMFVLAALGGAWVPLEITPESFQRIARLTPLAFTIDGFQDIIIRGLGLQAIRLSVLALLGYALLFGIFAVWRFKYE